MATHAGKNEGEWWRKKACMDGGAFLFLVVATNRSQCKIGEDDRPCNGASAGDSTWEHEPLLSSHETTAPLSLLASRVVFVKLVVRGDGQHGRCTCPYWLFVWNSVTRRLLWVPLLTTYVAKPGFPSYALVTVALLAVGDAGRSFRLLIVSSSTWSFQPSLSLRTQIYSKDDGTWGPVTEINDLPPEFPRCAPGPGRRRPEALVIGGTAVHWLHNDSGKVVIARLDIDKAKGTLITLPSACAHRSVDELQPAASTDGKLSMVVAELYVISMWTLSSAAAAPGAGGLGSARWTRQVVVRREAIARVLAGPCKDHRDLFLGFGELSSTVVLLVHHVVLVRINLRTKLRGTRPGIR